jgi:hypothetical protein
VATSAPKDGEFLRKISHQLIWWLHCKLSNVPYIAAVGVHHAPPGLPCLKLEPGQIVGFNFSPAALRTGTTPFVQNMQLSGIVKDLLGCYQPSTHGSHSSQRMEASKSKNSTKRRTEKKSPDPAMIWPQIERGPPTIELSVLGDYLSAVCVHYTITGLPCLQFEPLYSEFNFRVILRTPGLWG